LSLAIAAFGILRGLCGHIFELLGRIADDKIVSAT